MFLSGISFGEFLDELNSFEFFLFIVLSNTLLSAFIYFFIQVIEPSITLIKTCLRILSELKCNPKHCTSESLRVKKWVTKIERNGLQKLKGNKKMSKLPKQDEFEVKCSDCYFINHCDDYELSQGYCGAEKLSKKKGYCYYFYKEENLDV